MRRYGLTGSEAAASPSEREMEGAIRQSQTCKCNALLNNEFNMEKKNQIHPCIFLPLFNWQYARADEVDKLRQDYQDGINTLKVFMDATNEKMTAPVQVSFLNVRAFVQDVEVNNPYISNHQFS